MMRSYIDFSPARPTRKSHSGGSKRAVIGTDIKTGRSVEYPSIASTKEDGFSPALVTRCCQGDAEQHAGYKWRYKDDRMPECKWIMKCCYREHGKCTILTDVRTPDGLCHFRKADPDGVNLYDTTD